MYILSNLQCIRHEHFLQKGSQHRVLPLLLGVSVSWSDICPAVLSLYGFLNSEFLPMLAQLQWEDRGWPQPELCLKSAL